MVLHPLDGVAGQVAEVTHVNGSTEATEFPALVDPVQPIASIRAIKHEVVAGVDATCTMESETWETEDHRNWTDANFKTYSRPLTEPWPYTIVDGETVRQSVSLTFSGTMPAPIRIDVASEPRGAAPRIGIGVPAEYAAASLEVFDYLTRAAPQVWVCEYAPCLGDAPAVLEHYRDLVAAIEAEAVLPNEDDATREAEAIAADAAAAGFEPDAVVFTPRPHLMSLLPGSDRPAMPSFEGLAAASRAAFPGAVVGGGMHSILHRSQPLASAPGSVRLRDACDMQHHPCCR